MSMGMRYMWATLPVSLRFLMDRSGRETSRPQPITSRVPVRFRTYFSVTPSKDSTLWIKVDGTAKPEGITTVFPAAPAIVVGGTGRFEGAKGDGKFLGGVRLTPLAAGADYWNEFVINVKK